MAADQSRTPPPDAGGVPMTRRSLLKTGAGAATASAVLAADGPLDIESPVGDADAAVGTLTILAGSAALGYYFGTKMASYEEALDAEIQKDLAIAHDSAVSEMHSYGMIETTYRNDLETTDTLAHMEARSAIATAWETGKTAADAYDDALEAIRDYYAERVENNWIQATAKSATQLSYILTAAIEAEVDDGSTRDINDDAGGWGPGAIEHPTHGVVSWAELLDERSDVEIELQNNETITVPLPDMLLEWDGAGISKTVNLIRFLRNYNDSTGEFEVEIDGEMATWDGTLGVPSLSFEDSSLQSYQVMDLDDQYRSIRSQVDGQASTVIGNYDQGLVDSLYTKLDNGEITPAEVRGIDGQAEFLAGTSDASADAYRLSLLQQLDMEQADLSKIASMSGTFTGYDGLNVQRDSSGNRSIFLGNSVSDKQLDGQLFARSIPDAGLNAGGKYVVDPVVYSASWDNTVQAIDPSNGATRWEYSQHSDYVIAVTVSPDGSTVYTASEDNSVHAIDAVDGTQKWTYTGHSGPVADVVVSPDGSTIYTASDDQSVHSIATSDGSQNWAYTDNASIVEGVGVSPDGSLAFAAYYGGSVHAINTDDGSQAWTYGNHSGAVYDVAVSPDNSTLYTASEDNTVHAVDMSDQTKTWEYTGHSAIVTSVEVSPDGSAVYSGSWGNEVHSAATSDGTQNWVYTHPDKARSLSVSPDGSTLYAPSDSGVVHAIDTGSVSKIWSNDGHSDGVYGIACSYNPAVTGFEDYGGMILGGKFFDAPSSETVMMQNGILTLQSMSDQDGNDIETTSGEDWGDPDYDDLDLDGWIDYLIKTEEFRETIEQYIDETGTTGGGGTGSCSVLGVLPCLPTWFPFSGVTGYLVAGVATLFGVNVATN